MSLSEAERHGVRLDIVIAVLEAHDVSVTTIQKEVSGELWRFMQIAKDAQIEAQFLPAIVGRRMVLHLANKFGIQSRFFWNEAQRPEPNDPASGSVESHARERSSFRRYPRPVPASNAPRRRWRRVRADVAFETATPYAVLTSSETANMMIDDALLTRALELTELDAATPRTFVQAELLMDAYIAEFVAESESLAGNDSTAAEVLDAYREFVGRA